MSERSVRIWSGALGVGAYILLLVLDVATESEPVPLTEFLVDALEMALIVASATGVALLSGSLQRERAEKETLSGDLRVALAEGDAWRDRAQRHVAGLSEEIAKQFDEWQLTPAEREIGLLMLKGFSHREIASLRGTTEATVRFQARAIYQKSRMPGRSAFCAFFLEDLLPSKSLEPGDRPPI
jgi:DNA-binding CsgD family transcriptional regulator